MFAARRSAAPVRALLRRHQPRRAAHVDAHHAEPVNESFGVCSAPVLVPMPSILLLLELDKKVTYTIPNSIQWPRQLSIPPILV